MKTFADYVSKVFVRVLKDKHHDTLFQGMDEKKFALPNKKRKPV